MTGPTSRGRPPSPRCGIADEMQGARRDDDRALPRGRSSAGRRAAVPADGAAGRDRRRRRTPWYDGGTISGSCSPTAGNLRAGRPSACNVRPPSAPCDCLPAFRPRRLAPGFAAQRRSNPAFLPCKLIARAALPDLSVGGRSQLLGAGRVPSRQKIAETPPRSVRLPGWPSSCYTLPSSPPQRDRGRDLHG